MLYRKNKYRIGEINIEGDQYYIVQRYGRGIWATFKANGGSNRRFSSVGEAKNFIYTEKLNALHNPPFRIIEEL